MPSLEVLSLAVNYVSTLSDFKFCPNLQELYMRGNKIDSLWELEHLQGLRKLKIISLSENPIASSPSYRKAIIKMVPWIEKIDN